MSTNQQITEPCDGCGLAVAGGSSGCQRIMDELLARDFSDAAYFRVHRMLVDTYCLKHPARYCESFKSLAAHLAGLCLILEHDANAAIGGEALRRWLERNPHRQKPELPLFRGAMTIADVARAPDAEAHARAVRAWARSTWEAYAPLHSLARRWVDEALAGSPGR